MTGGSPPLAGFRVLDCTDELGVYATRLLAGMGADVVRVEPATGDPMRTFPPLTAPAGDGAPVSLYYEHFNAGKRAVTLDRDEPGARARSLALVATCHALVESGDPDALFSRWLGEEQLLGTNPALTLVTVTPFGRQGPYAGDAGGDLVIAARAGLLWLSGRPDGPPYRPGGEQTAHMASLMAANAALLGIFQAQRTGRGARVDVPACFAATLATLQTANANYYTWHGRLPVRRGMGPAFARHIYPAADGWVALTALPGQWDNLVRLLRAHDAAADLGDERYQDANLRIAEAEHINDVLAAFTSHHPKAYLFEAAQRAGVASAPVNTPADVLADPFLRERGFFRTLQHPVLARDLDYAGPAARFSGRESGPHAPAPVRGADDAAIWAEVSGAVAELG